MLVRCCGRYLRWIERRICQHEIYFCRCVRASTGAINTFPLVQVRRASLSSPWSRSSSTRTDAMSSYFASRGHNPIQATTSPIFHRWFTLMHLRHSLTVSDIRPPRVIYDFLSSNETILLGILRGRLRNPVEIIYTANRVIFSGWKSFPIPNDVMDVICFYIFYGVYYFYVTKEMILLFD